MHYPAWESVVNRHVMAWQDLAMEGSECGKVVAGTVGSRPVRVMRTVSRNGRGGNLTRALAPSIPRATSRRPETRREVSQGHMFGCVTTSQDQSEPLLDALWWLGSCRGRVLGCHWPQQSSPVTLWLRLTGTVASSAANVPCVCALPSCHSSDHWRSDFDSRRVLARGSWHWKGCVSAIR